jgi:hypothetical protein
MPLADQHLRAQIIPIMGHEYFRTHFNVLQLNTNNQNNLINNKRRHSQALIVLKKAKIIKFIFINKKEG